MTFIILLDPLSTPKKQTLREGLSTVFKVEVREGTVKTEVTKTVQTANKRRVTEPAIIATSDWSLNS